MCTEMGEAAKTHDCYLYELTHGLPTIRGLQQTLAALWRQDCLTRRLPPGEEAELVRRGMVTRVEVDGDV